MTVRITMAACHALKPDKTYGKDSGKDCFKINPRNTRKADSSCSILSEASLSTSFYHHFHYYATFLFKTPLSTLQYASVNHTLYGKCVMLPQLN